MILRVGVIWKSTYLPEKNLPPFAPLVGSYAIVHQRSVISVIISENSSLLLIVI